MNKNLKELIEKRYYINYLIKRNVISMDYVIDQVIESKDAELIYCAAENINNAPIDKLADAIIETKDAKYIYTFAAYIENAPINRLADAIIETKNAEYIYKFILNIWPAPIDKLADALLEIGDIEYIYKLASYAKGTILCKAEEAIYNSNNMEYIYKLEKNILYKSADEIIDKFQNDNIRLDYLYHMIDQDNEDKILEYADEFISLFIDDVNDKQKIRKKVIDNK